VQTFKRLLSKFQCGDIHARLARVLYSMRTSPSSRNGKTPSESLGRPFRTHLTHCQLHPEFDLSREAAKHVSTLRPGECAWFLKHSAKWMPGVVIKKLRFENVWRQYWLWWHNAECFSRSRSKVIPGKVRKRRRRNDAPCDAESTHVSLPTLSPKYRHGLLRKRLPLQTPL